MLNTSTPPRRQIDTWQDAELNAAAWMRHWGFTDARAVPGGSDGGIDVRARNALAQVKFQGAPVGRPVVQNLVGARMNSSAKLLFFTGSAYSKTAVEYADAMNVALFTYDPWGRMRPVNGRARRIVDGARSAHQAKQRQERTATASAAAPKLATGAGWARLAFFAFLLPCSWMYFGYVADNHPETLAGPWWSDVSWIGGSWSIGALALRRRRSLRRGPGGADRAHVVAAKRILRQLEVASTVAERKAAESAASRVLAPPAPEQSIAGAHAAPTPGRAPTPGQPDDVYDGVSKLNRGTLEAAFFVICLLAPALWLLNGDAPALGEILGAGACWFVAYCAFDVRRKARRGPGGIEHSDSVARFEHAQLFALTGHAAAVRSGPDNEPDTSADDVGTAAAAEGGRWASMVRTGAAHGPGHDANSDIATSTAPVDTEQTGRVEVGRPPRPGAT